MTDLFVEPTNAHQFLDPSSSHSYHCKKVIPYSQALGSIESVLTTKVSINVATI